MLVVLKKTSCNHIWYSNIKALGDLSQYCYMYCITESVRNKLLNQESFFTGSVWWQLQWPIATDVILPKYLIYIVWCLQYWVSLETTNCRFKQLVFVQSLFEHSKHVLAAVCLHISASVDGWTAGPDSCRVFEVLLTQTLIILKALNCSKPSIPH